MIHIILDTWIAFMWRRFGQPDHSLQVGQGRNPTKRHYEVNQSDFWCIYLFVVLPLVGSGIWWGVS